MKWWRSMWDTIYSIASIALALALGLVLGNVLQGMPIGADKEFTGSWLMFLNPYAFLTAFTTLALFMMHGAIYLLMKTEGRLYAKLTILLKRSIIAFILLFSLTSLYTLIYIPHLSDDFQAQPLLFVVPVLTFLAIANIPRLATKRKFKSAFFFSALSIALLLVLVAIELYPTMLLSTLDPAYSIDVYTAASSEKSLGIMLLFAAIGIPLVGGYTYFVYKTFAGKVELDEMSY